MGDAGGVFLKGLGKTQTYWLTPQAALLSSPAQKKASYSMSSHNMALWSTQTQLLTLSSWDCGL